MGTLSYVEFSLVTGVNNENLAGPTLGKYDAL